MNLEKGDGLTVMPRLRAWIHEGQHLAFIIATLGGLLAVAMRAYFCLHTDVYQPLRGGPRFGDAAEYYRYAWNLTHHHLFASGNADPTHPVADSFRDPGYPAYLAMFMSLTTSYEAWYGLVILSHAVLGGVTVACIVLALRGTVPTACLAIVAVATALWPHSVAISAYVLSENLTAPLWALAILLLRETATRTSMPIVVTAGVTLAAASLTNAVLTPLVIPLALVFAWKRVMPPRLIICLIIATAIPVAAWSIRNAQVTTGVSSRYRAEMNLVQGSWPTYHMATQLVMRNDPVGIQTERAINHEIAVLDADPRTGLGLMAERMGHSPGIHLAWYLSKPTLLWGWEIGLGSGDIYVYPTSHSPFITHPAWRAIEAMAFVINGLLAALALAGTLLALGRRETGVAMLAFSVTTVWITLVYGLLQSDPRYSIPFRGAEMALACFAVWSAARALSRRLGEAPHKIS